MLSITMCSEKYKKLTFATLSELTAAKGADIARKAMRQISTAKRWTRAVVVNGESDVELEGFTFCFNPRDLKCKPVQEYFGEKFLASVSATGTTLNGIPFAIQELMNALKLLQDDGVLVVADENQGPQKIFVNSESIRGGCEH